MLAWVGLPPLLVSAKLHDFWEHSVPADRVTRLPIPRGWRCDGRTRPRGGELRDGGWGIT